MCATLEAALHVTAIPRTLELVVEQRLRMHFLFVRNNGVLGTDDAHVTLDAGEHVVSGAEVGVRFATTSTVETRLARVAEDEHLTVVLLRHVTAQLFLRNVRSATLLANVRLLDWLPCWSDFCRNIV